MSRAPSDSILGRNLVLETAEGVAFRIPLAGPFSRAIAFTLDFGMVTVLSGVVGSLAGLLRWLNPELAVAFTGLLTFGLSIGYGVVCEHWLRGKTLGKRFAGIRVLDYQGRKLRFQQVLLRNLLRVVDALPLFYLVGMTSLTLSSRNQRLGDLVAGTVVVMDADPQLPRSAPESESAASNSLLERPRIAKRVRQSLSPEDYLLACETLARRDQLAPDARLKVLAALARHLRERVDLPPECVESVSDERLIRNIVEVVSREG